MCIAVASVRRRHVPRDVAIGACVLGVMIVAYYAVYVLTPYDLEWHLRTSAVRLLAQLWPAMVWSTVLAMSGSAQESR